MYRTFPCRMRLSNVRKVFERRYGVGTARALPPLKPGRREPIQEKTPAMNLALSFSQESRETRAP